MIKISEILSAMASWLEDPNNEAIVLAEEDPHCLNIVVNSCVLAADQLKKAAAEVEYFEPKTTHLTSESLESLSKISLTSIAKSYIFIMDLKEEGAYSYKVHQLNYLKLLLKNKNKELYQNL